jgi:hypothetical protein
MAIIMITRIITTATTITIIIITGNMAKTFPARSANAETR